MNPNQSPTAAPEPPVAIPLQFFLNPGPAAIPAPVIAAEDQQLRFLKNFPDPMFLLDPQGLLVHANGAGNEFLAVWGVNGALPPALVTLARRSSGQAVSFLPRDWAGCIMLERGEDVKWVWPSIVAGEKPGLPVTVVLRDISDFQALDWVKSQAISTASHEIKTPLTTVRTSLYLLLDHSFGSLNAKQHDLAEEARLDLERALALVNQLLDLETLETGQPVLKREFVDVLDVVEVLQRDVRDLLRLKNLDLSIEVGADVPALYIDRERIFLALRNLLHNAIKYSPLNNAIEFAVCLCPEGEVLFRVRDHGPGIAAHQCEKVFEKFYRVPGQPKAGSGLGLAIAREIVRVHQGKIGCQSEPGRGCEFYIRLPPRPGKAAKAEAEFCVPVP